MRVSSFTTLACLALGQAAQFHSIDDAWSFDVGSVDNADWMKTIPDDTLLSSLAIPGTHDSMTYSLKSSMVQTQNVPLSDQLIGGIRYIDISCKTAPGHLQVYHGLFNTGYSLNDVFTTLFDFLDQHPKEAIILRIQKGGMFGRTKSFLKLFEEYFFEDNDTGDRASYRVYSNGDKGISTVPTLGELRGQVFILQDFETSPSGLYGLPWNSDTVSTYSPKLAPGGLFLKSQWGGVKSHLSKQLSGSPNKLRITHTTVGAGVSPINVAARNNPNAGMNTFLGQYLWYNEGDCFGIVVMDFPGRYLVEEILKLNGYYRAPVHSSDNTDSTPSIDASHAT